MRHLFIVLFIIPNLILCQAKNDAIPSIQNNLVWLSNLELDLNKAPQQSLILNNLHSENIDEITILKGLSATALFGIKGNCGVVYLKTNKKFSRNFINTNQ